MRLARYSQESTPQIQPHAGLRHVTIFFSDIAGFSDLARTRGDLEASGIVNRLLTLQEIIITRDGAGEVLQFGGDSVFAIFDTPSMALNRALEIQRVLDTCAADEPLTPSLQVRIGLHMGEVFMKAGERVEVISRHVNRAHRVMEAAGPGQILASDVVVDSARDFLDIPHEHQAIRDYGEFYLKGVGPTALSEVADLRFRKPEPPSLPRGCEAQAAVASRLESAGYRLGRRLSETATGVLYEAEQISTRRKVALKLLSPLLLENPARLTEHFSRVEEVSDQAFAQLVECRVAAQPAFVTREYVEGESIEEVVSLREQDDLARTFRDVCLTLNSVHAAGMVHGNIKPGNILMRKDNSPVLLDFGITAFSSSTSGFAATMISPAYVAPEIIEGQKPAPQSDIYALGVLLFKLLAGKEPFTGDSVHDVLEAHLHEDPAPPSSFNPSVPEGLQRICLKALEKNPAERYSTAAEMAEDLDRFLRNELVHTRPTVYDNLLYHRAQAHIEAIHDWSSRGLLTPEESHRLLSSYEGLRRRGLPAAMEGKVFRLWQTLVYIGGWAVINGSLLWLIQYWQTLSRGAKLLLGSIPAMTTATLALLMWRAERFRLFFVAVIVAILATPLLTGVWLHEFHVASAVAEPKLSQEWFHADAASNAFTNAQILLTSIVTLIVALGAAAFTKTTTHSAQALGAAVITYFSYLSLHGMRTHAQADEWATVALQSTPLLVIIGGAGFMLLVNRERYYQAAPWIYVAAVLFLLICYAIAGHGFEEWGQIPKEVRKPLACLTLAIFGVLETTIGLLARGRFAHHCRLATRTLVFFGLVNALGGLALAGWVDVWPQKWAAASVFGKAVPWPHALLPLAALVITLLACRHQMFAFLLVGLAGLAFSVHVLGHLYFKDVPAWPKILIVTGAVFFFAALFRELRRTRGNVLDDIVTQSRF